jgi:integrase
VKNGWLRFVHEARLPQRRAHGLRKAGATLAAEIGATAAQPMAICDWTTIGQAEVYTRAARRKRMAGEAMHKIAGDQSGNDGLSHRIGATRESV